MHVSGFSRCPSSAPAGVTVVSGRFWQIVSSQREVQIYSFLVGRLEISGPFLLSGSSPWLSFSPVRAGTRGIPRILARLHSCESTCGTLHAKRETACSCTVHLKIVNVPAGKEFQDNRFELAVRKVLLREHLEMAIFGGILVS